MQSGISKNYLELLKSNIHEVRKGIVERDSIIKELEKKV